VKINLKFLEGQYLQLKNIKKVKNLLKIILRVIRPGYGLAPKYFNKILNKKSPINILKDEPLKPIILKNL
jgi:sialic acid synthase SpsE